MGDKKEQKGGKRRGRLPVRAPRVDIRDVGRSLGERLTAIGRWFAKDPLSTTLIVSSLVLTFLFFNLLGQIQPSTNGERVPLSRVFKLADEKQIAEATLLDQDARVLFETKGRLLLYASYPESDAQTSSLVRELTKSGAVVGVDQQWDKPAKQIVVQFLIPILLLVCLFVLFTRLVHEEAEKHQRNVHEVVGV